MEASVIDSLIEVMIGLIQCIPSYFDTPDPTFLEAIYSPETWDIPTPCAQQQDTPTIHQLLKWYSFVRPYWGWRWYRVAIQSMSSALDETSESPADLLKLITIKGLESNLILYLNWGLFRNPKQRNGSSSPSTQTRWIFEVHSRFCPVEYSNWRIRRVVYTQYPTD